MLRRSLACLLSASLLLAACGDDDDADDGASAPTPTPTSGADVLTCADASDDLDAIEVDYDPADETTAPVFTFDRPFSVEETSCRTLAEGDGEAAELGSFLTFHLVFVNGRDAREIDSSYGFQPAQVPLEEALLPGVLKALIGVRPGTVRLVAIAPDDAFAGQGDDEASGVREDDTLLFFVHVLDVTTPLQRAEGEPVEPPEGLPLVELDEDGAPTIRVPEGEPPAELVVQPLIRGEGPEVQVGDTISAHYTGVVWDGGQQFDSSWGRGSPSPFEVGTGRVIAGWDEGLVGQPVGSQVLLVIPADKAYGPEGRPPTIPGGATLVFVVDILAIL